MDKSIGENISKNLNSKYSQKLLDKILNFLKLLKTSYSKRVI